MRIRYFGHSDVGRSREHNEDSHLADPDLGVFVVADGVGDTLINYQLARDLHTARPLSVRSAPTARVETRASR
jgi:serine/threonine protein phosphatase PrpC